MAKIVYSMLTSLDGYIARSDEDIALPVPETELHQHFNDMMRRASVVLAGRRMYETMRFWDSPDRETPVRPRSSGTLPAPGERHRRSSSRPRFGRSGPMPGW
ncbi:dihydrofolate reductase [Mesorhizobium jarvisii]